MPRNRRASVPQAETFTRPAASRDANLNDENMPIQDNHILRNKHIQVQSEHPLHEPKAYYVEALTYEGVKALRELHNEGGETYFYASERGKVRAEKAYKRVMEILLKNLPAETV